MLDKGPDEIGPCFYKAAWPAVCDDVMLFHHRFHLNGLDLDCINWVFVMLLSKQPGTDKLDAFRPVSLQNCPMKVLSKIVTTRLHAQISDIINVDQTGFIRGRSIMENFVLTTELVQTCHWRCAATIVLMLDFTKAFDSIAWPSLLRVLRA